MTKYNNDSNNTITISLLPKEYIDKYGHITVHLPSGKKIPLREAYTQYGPTHIKISDVPYLTDFSITQQLLDDATTKEVEKEQADRNIHTNFNMTTPDSEGLHNFNRVVSPILKGAAVAGGLAYALPVAYSGITNWALANPTLARQLYTGALGGGAFDISSILGGYDDFGHLAYTATGEKNWEKLPDWQKFLWNFTNLGYSASAKPIKTAETLGEQALRQTFEGIPINPTTKDLAKAMNKEVKDKLFVNLVPGQIGWAPRQTLTGYHASNEPIQEFNYWFPNWAVREHNAPYGIYFTANETKPSGGFLAKRPYIEQVTSIFDKPMIQIGEIPASAKNTTRNTIERQALSMGADGIIYQGIKDNQLENQTIVKTLNPDLKVNVSEIIESDPYLVTKILDNEKIRLRLPTHTKDLPREIVLEPQGNNQYRIHIRTWNGDHVPANLDPKEKQALFESVYNELPEGAEILFPESSVDYPATRGTVAALTRLSKDPRFLRGNTTGTLIYTDKNGNLQTFTGNSFIILPKKKYGGTILKYGIGGWLDDVITKGKNVVSKEISHLTPKAEPILKKARYLNYLSPSTWIGTTARIFRGNKSGFHNLMLLGKGLTTSAFEASHPIAAMLLNLGLDFALDPIAGITKTASGAAKTANTITKSAENAIKTSKLATKIEEYKPIVKTAGRIANIGSKSLTKALRLRMWKTMFYISEGSPAAGKTTALARLSGTKEYENILQYIKTGDRSYLKNLDKGYIGLVTKEGLESAKTNLESKAKQYIDFFNPEKIDLVDLTLNVKDSHVNVPAIYKLLEKSDGILPKSQMIDIIGGKVIGSKKAITNKNILQALESTKVKGITPIVAKNPNNGQKAIYTLNNETPILLYTLELHRIASADGVFNTGGMRNYVYSDPKTGGYKIVEVDIFKHSDLDTKYITKPGNTIKEKTSALGNSFIKKVINTAEDSPVLIVNERQLTSNDIINHLAQIDKYQKEWLRQFNAKEITYNLYQDLMKTYTNTENKLYSMLSDIKSSSYYLKNKTPLSTASEKLPAIKQVEDNIIIPTTTADKHIDSAARKILTTLSKKPIKHIKNSNLEYHKTRLNESIIQNEEKNNLMKTAFDKISKGQNDIYDTLQLKYSRPKEYDKAIANQKELFFKNIGLEESLQMLFLSEYSTSLNPRKLRLPSETSKQLNTKQKATNTLYILNNYSKTAPNKKEMISIIKNGYTSLPIKGTEKTSDIEKIIKIYKTLFGDYLQLTVPFIDDTKKVKTILRSIKKMNEFHLGGILLPDNLSY